MGSCYNSTVVDTPVEKTWETVRNFHQLGWAAPVVERVDPVGDIPGDQPGARRVLNGMFHETLVSFDDEGHEFSYSIDDGPGPVSNEAVENYLGVVQLHPVTDTGQTLVVWTSSYDSDDPAAVGDFCNPIYQGLLAALKDYLKD
ncbi:MAG: SRPBCC family protein [Xanthomonadales bacterium]|nr:SRPBCC family protein [Xanthomonadales bacterium]